MASSQSGETVHEIWMNGNDVRNDVSDLVADTTANSERFTSTTVMAASVGTSFLRLSEAFVLQSKDHS